MSETILNIVDLKQIDLLDKTFKISLSTTPDIDGLATSINTTGLICPLLLRPVKPDTYIIICGFNRVKALIKTQITQVPAVIVSETATDLDCYKKAIAALAFKRPLTHAELILCIKRLMPLCDIQMIEKMAKAVFNLALTAKFIQDLEQITKLPDLSLDLIHKEHLTLKSARRLTAFDEESILIFLDLFSKIKASSSKQLEIITFIKEICARDGISIDGLYQDDQIGKILSNPELPPGIKTNALRSVLFKKRFPSVSAARQGVQKKINDLELGNTIKLTPPENFEGAHYLFSFKAKDLAAFDTCLHKLNQMSQNKTLEQILSHED